MNDRREHASRARGVLAVAALLAALFEHACWLARSPGVLDGLLAALPRLFGVPVVATPDTGLPVIATLLSVSVLFSADAADVVRASLASVRWCSLRMAWLLPRLRLIQRTAVLALVCSALLLARALTTGADPSAEAGLRVLFTVGIVGNLVLTRFVLFNLPGVSDAFQRREARRAPVSRGSRRTAPRNLQDATLTGSDKPHD